MAIHPRQVPVINTAFTPSAAEIERARRVVDAYEAARAAGQGVTRMDNQMVELPIVERARRTLALAASTPAADGGGTPASRDHCRCARTGRGGALRDASARRSRRACDQDRTPRRRRFRAGADTSVKGLSAHFVWLNRSKESLTVDLKHPAAGNILQKLLQRADVFVQNLAPGAADRLGLSAPTLCGASEDDRLQHLRLRDIRSGTHRRKCDLLACKEPVWCPSRAPMTCRVA